MKWKYPLPKTRLTKVVTKLTNNKSSGPDNVLAKMIKHSPEIIHEMTAEIFQKTLARKKTPEIRRKGTLLSLPKTSKEGINVNVRPIILLSSLRKLLSNVHDIKMLRPPLNPHTSRPS